MEYLVLAAIGCAAGLLQGLFSGGGLLIVPALIYLSSYTGMPVTHDIVHVSVATALACITISGIAIAHFNHQRESIRWDLFNKFLPGVIAGSLLGSFVASAVTSNSLLLIISAHAFAGGIYVLSSKQKVENTIHNPWIAHAFSLLAGLISAMAGIAGATVTVPYFLHKGVDVVHALATSIAIGVVITALSTLNFIVLGVITKTMPESFLGYVWMPGVGVISLFAILSGYLSTRFIHGNAKVIIRHAFGVFSLIVGIVVLAKMF